MAISRELNLGLDQAEAEELGISCEENNKKQLLNMFILPGAWLPLTSHNHLRVQSSLQVTDRGLAISHLGSWLQGKVLLNFVNTLRRERSR
jgi:hypothetical protein